MRNKLVTQLSKASVANRRSRLYVGRMNESTDIDIDYGPLVSLVGIWKGDRGNTLTRQ